MVPIIINSCLWLEDEKISEKLAIPEDGKPIESYDNKDNGWVEVVSKVNVLLEHLISIKNIKIKNDFNKFLKSSEMFEKSHPNKEKLLLKDIFISPDLEKINIKDGKEKNINFDHIIKNTDKNNKIVLVGEDLSGKTTLCKKIYMEYFKKDYLPVYLNDKNNNYNGNLKNKIIEAFRNQYETELKFDEIEKNKIIPILDDFHYAENKEKKLKYINEYRKTFLVLDDISSFNIKNRNTFSEYKYFRIKEYKPSLRNNLVEKWLDFEGNKDNDYYRELDNKTNLIDNVLGKNIGNGIMSSYPFYILSIIMSHETYQPLEKEKITSQGYCYQSLIYFYLRRKGIKGDQIDTYFNFLTEISYYIYKNDNIEMNLEELEVFLNKYEDKYNLPIERKHLLNNLKEIYSKDSFGNYSFRYKYFYYFFVARYFSENIFEDEIKNIINKMINNLHLDENAYIIIFLTHHTKKDEILDEILINAMLLFENHKPVMLKKGEMKRLDEKADIIFRTSLPSLDTVPENERKEKLEIYDEIEKNKDNLKENNLDEELRRAVKTVEVMGSIIKNRAGSLEKDKLKKIFLEGMNVHLRILSSFFEIIEYEEEIVEYISKNIDEITKDKKLNDSEKTRKAKSMFWNLLFFMTYGIFKKIIQSLGSDNLTKVVSEINNKDEEGFSYFLVKQGIYMWHNKNVKVNEITHKMSDDNISEIVKKLIRLMVTDYSRYHKIAHKDRQRLEDKLNLKSKALLQ